MICPWFLSILFSASYIWTCHLSLVSPLFAAKLVLSYMLHRDTGKQGPEQDDSAELPEPSPTYQPPQSFTANTPSTLLGPKVTRSLFAKWGRILVLSPNNIYFIWHSEKWKQFGLSSYPVPHKDQCLRIIIMSSCPFDCPTLNLFLP